MKTNHSPDWPPLPDGLKCFVRRFRYVPAFALLLVFKQDLRGNPAGMTVAAGSATAHQNGSQLTVTTSPVAVLNWQSFNIAAGESTIFNQPSAASLVINRIGDANASQIFGTLQANGRVVLMNASGFYFGPNAYVQTGGLIVSTANFLPPQNAGGAWEFNGPPPLASIVNYGQIKIGNGGDCFFIADQIENHGSIEAPGGNLGFAAGQTVTVSERPDGRGMSMQVQLPQGSVNNYGNLVADGGMIALNAKVVNQDGIVQANSVHNDHGIIELVASDSLTLGAGSQIVADGDASAHGSGGGEVTLKSGNTFSDAAGSEIAVTGGANGGNGGEVEISAPVMPAIQTKIDGHAQPGSRGGTLLLDPDYIVLDGSGTDSTGGSGTVLVNDDPGGTLDLDVASAFTGFSQITLQAKYDITLADNTAWNLSDSTGQAGGQLTLEAGRNIIFGNSSALADSGSWSIALYAGVANFANPTTVISGAGSIYLNAFNPNDPNNVISSPSGSIQTSQGSITLKAGLDVIVGTGSVTTLGGGSINVGALAGDVDTGTDTSGYIFNSGPDFGYFANPGGISTAAGGDVNITAGKNVVGVLPLKAGSGYLYDGAPIDNGTSDGTAGSGAFGPEKGNVTIVAGGDVTGNYVVANGAGSIYAGAALDANGNPVVKTDSHGNPITRKDAEGNVALDASGNPIYVYALDPNSSGSAGTADEKLALTLIDGGWNVSAANNIILQEVRNPNGVFQSNGNGPTPKSAYHQFDYALDAYVDLFAGNSVQLGDSASSLPRGNLQMPFIYAPILNIMAGAGGVQLTGDASPLNQLILYPSAQGSLTIVTTDGGTLSAGSLFDLVVSDSAQTQYFIKSGGIKNPYGATDHASKPVHYGNPTPVLLDISGDMDDVRLVSPESAQINVVGNMNNSFFQGQNLSADTQSGATATIQEADGSTHTVDFYPGISSINVGASAKKNMEDAHWLDSGTDAGLTVGGEINNRSEFTTIDLSQILSQSGTFAPLLSYLSQAYGDSLSAEQLAPNFYYDPATKQLTYQAIAGQDINSVVALLQNLQYQVYQNGVPQFDLSGAPITAHIAVLDPETAAALVAEYTLLGPVSSAGSGFGYVIGGPGELNIHAGDINLGTSAGIQSLGVDFSTTSKVGPDGKPFTTYLLAKYFSQGADINVQADGNLDMFSTAIASLNGGSIAVNAGGYLNVGSDIFTPQTGTARGIYTSSGGDVTVVAGGDINVNGSRIGTYDGGNVTVESLNGDVNAGKGASSTVIVQGFYVDPATQNVYTFAPQLPFSGILALTFPPRDASYPGPDATLGNILVETPNGDINANSAGILQIPLNGNKYPSSTTALLAGYELEDGLGNPLTAANLPATDDDWSQALHQISTGRNINTGGSGVIGSTVKLNATGDIVGVIFARENIELNALQNVNVTALAQGNINVSSGGTISGTIIGVGGVSASGSSIDASLISANVTGATSGQSGLGQGTAANATSQSASSDDTAKAAAASDNNDDDPLKKKKGITLAQKVSRVTVLLPAKN